MLAPQVAQSKGGDAAARAEAKRSPDVWKKGGKPWMADAYRLAFGCFTRSLFWDQYLSRDWDHNVCKKWHCLSKSIEISWLPWAQGQRNNQGYTKNLWELCNSEMWRWWRVNSPRAVSAEGLCIPASVKLLTAGGWDDMKRHETMAKPSKAFGHVGPEGVKAGRPAHHFHNKLSGDGQWNEKMMLFSALATRFASESLFAYLQAYHDVSCHV